MTRYSFEVRTETYYRMRRVACRLGMTMNQLLDEMIAAAERGAREADAAEAIRLRSEAS